jgi:DNA invertase Pin-like site-specific DNA recombinase
MNQRTNNRVCLFTRVSTEKQDYERQILELKEYCQRQGYDVVKTIATKITGSKTQKERPDLLELMSLAKRKQFDKVLVTEISRIGRNAKDIRNTVDQLHSLRIGIIFKNLGLESLDEAGQETFVTNIIIAIYAELAQEEKRILVDRIRSGIRAAQAKGKKLGRPNGLEETAKFLKKYPGLVKDLGNGLSIRKVMRIHNLSKGTVIKAKQAIHQVEFL